MTKPMELDMYKWALSLYMLDKFKPIDSMGLGTLNSTLEAHSGSNPN